MPSGRVCARLTRLGDMHPPQRLGPIDSGPHLDGESRRGTPPPRRPRCRRSSPHQHREPRVGSDIDPRRSHHVAAGDLVEQRRGTVAPDPDLALRYSTRWRARTGSTPSVSADGPSRHAALIRVPPFAVDASMKQGPFAPDGLCCPDRHHYYDPLRLPLDRRPLPGVTGYRTTRFPSPAATGPRRASPVPRTTI